MGDSSDTEGPESDVESPVLCPTTYLPPITNSLFSHLDADLIVEDNTSMAVPINSNSKFKQAANSQPTYNCFTYMDTSNELPAPPSINLGTAIKHPVVSKLIRSNSTSAQHCPDSEIQWLLKKMPKWHSEMSIQSSYDASELRKLLKYVGVRAVTTDTKGQLVKMLLECLQCRKFDSLLSKATNDATPKLLPEQTAVIKSNDQPLQSHTSNPASVALRPMIVIYKPEDYIPHSGIITKLEQKYHHLEVQSRKHDITNNEHPEKKHRANTTYIAPIPSCESITSEYNTCPSSKYNSLVDEIL